MTRLPTICYNERKNTLECHYRRRSIIRRMFWPLLAIAAVSLIGWVAL